ncbi:hypothetical protein RQP46_010131 [Phenoliferia psychrophenolica]
MAPTDDLVLVTGATGFLGTQIVLTFIEKGFNVRATARSQDKIAEWEAKHGEATKGHLEWAIVKDIVEPAAFDEAIKGVTILVHTASPFHFKVEDNLRDILNPAIKGTAGALLAAKATPSVKRVVLLSSAGALVDVTKTGPEMTYDDDTWNPATLEEAAASPHPGYVYMASKGLAEKEAWRIAKDADFALTTICPPYVFGPPKQVIKSMDSLNTSAAMVWAIVDAKEIASNHAHVWAESRDVAEAHVLAATLEVAKGQRYAFIEGNGFDNSQIADIIRRHFPEQAHRVPVAPIVEDVPHYKTNSDKVQQQLGIKFRDFESTIIDTVRELFAIEKSLQK